VVEKGIKIAGSSDCSVASADPFLGIYSAVSPKDLEGNELPDWVRKKGLE
jgi:predicted amidohydrolase YtcJ